MNNIKWILDIKVIEEINAKGYADVTVKDILEMCGDNIKRCHDVENDVALGKYDMLSDEVKNNLLSGSAKLRDLAVRIYNQYKLRDENEVTRFTKTN